MLIQDPDPHYNQYGSKSLDSKFAVQICLNSHLFVSWTALPQFWELHGPAPRGQAGLELHQLPAAKVHAELGQVPAHRQLTIPGQNKKTTLIRVKARLWIRIQEEKKENQK